MALSSQERMVAMVLSPSELVEERTQGDDTDQGPLSLGGLWQFRG